MELNSKCKRPKTTSSLADFPMSDEMNSAVNPEHYKNNAFGIELIEVMQKNLTRAEFLGYCRGNAIKYRMRAGRKSDSIEQDINKALWYEQKLNEVDELPF